MIGEDRWARRRAERDEADEGGPDEAGSRQADGQADGQTDSQATGEEGEQQQRRRTRAGVTIGASPLRWWRRLGPEPAHHPRNTPPLAPTIARDLSRGAAETDVHMLYFA